MFSSWRRACYCIIRYKIQSFCCMQMKTMCARVTREGGSACRVWAHFMFVCSQTLESSPLSLVWGKSLIVTKTCCFGNILNPLLSLPHPGHDFQPCVCGVLRNERPEKILNPAAVTAVALPGSSLLSTALEPKTSSSCPSAHWALD